MKQARVIKFGNPPTEGYPPLPPYNGLRPLSILDPLFRWLEHRSETIRRPPNGYGSLVCPRSGVVNRQLSLRVTLANPIDVNDNEQLRWLSQIPQAERQPFYVMARVELTDAFSSWSQDSIKVPLGSNAAPVAIEFVLLPKLNGRHSVRLWLNYPTSPPDLRYDFPIHVRSRVIDALNKGGIVVGLLAGIAGIATLIITLIS